MIEYDIKNERFIDTNGKKQVKHEDIKIIVNQNKFAQILDWKKIPEQLLFFTEDVIQQELEDCSPYAWYQQFRQYKVSCKKLTDYLQPQFNFDITNRVFYQIVRPGIATHIDTDRVIIYNYLLNTGGPEVYTVWYDTDKTTEKYRIKIPSFTWHSLDVSTNHTVLGIETVRIAISVFENVKTKRYYD
jgi:hypothetical protein